MQESKKDNVEYRSISGREIAALLNPRPAVLVTCCDENGVPNAISVAWHTPLSHEPPLVGISIGKTRYSHGLIEKTGEFVINIVDITLQRAIEICGSTSGANCNKIAMAGLELCQASTVHCPFIGGALGYLECRLEQQVPAGDHTLFIARVTRAMVQASRFTNSWLPSMAKVLLCWKGDRFGFGVYEE